MNKLRLYSPWCIWEHKHERSYGHMLIKTSDSAPLELYARKKPIGVATIYFCNTKERESNSGWWYDFKEGI